MQIPTPHLKHTELDCLGWGRGAMEHAFCKLPKWVLGGLKLENPVLSAAQILRKGQECPSNAAMATFHTS